jgi:glycosyltransferase involved in cell wall biosynthesis
VIGSNIDGIPELLDHGEAGFLVPPKDSEMLANAIRNLLINPQELQSLQKRSQLNLDRFQVQRVCNEVLNIYQELLDGK